jgi:cell division protein FtsW (lipid II flippase)
MDTRIGIDGIILLVVFEMKTPRNTFDFWEWGIIVLAFILLVLPEILYSCILRARDWIVDKVMEL